MPANSWIWNHFNKIPGAGICKYCQEEIVRKNGATSSIAYHLQQKHNLTDPAKDLTATSSASSENLPKTKLTQQKLPSSFKSKSLGFMLAECAAYDNIPINTMIRSSAVKCYITSRGYEMPRSATKIWTEIDKYFKSLMDEMMDKIKSKVQNGVRFSISLDEWTDNTMQRFLLLILHDHEELFRLGLVPIPNVRCTASVIHDLVEKKLQDFSISIQNHIVCTINDAASVMGCYGRMLGAEVQLCLNHGSHLAITDNLYEKKKKKKADCSNDDDDDGRSDFVFEDLGLQDDDNELFNLEPGDSDEICIEIHEFKGALKYVRQIYQYFCKAAYKRSQLKEEFQKNEEKSLTVLIDSPTRWNSMFPMVERYLLIKNKVEKVMEANGEAQKFYRCHDSALSELLRVLSPIKDLVELLSSRQCDLVVAEFAFLKTLEKLEAINILFSTTIFNSLLDRYKERRNKNLVSLLILLQTKSYPKKSKYVIYSSDKEIKQTAATLMNRLFPSESNPNQNEDDEQNDHNTAQNSLRESVNTMLMPKKNEKLTLSKEIDCMVLTKERSTRLEKLFIALKSVQPTSTSCEQTFSTSSAVKNKVRNRLSSDHLSKLVLLRYHFKDLEC